jgi:outer membrane protein assembly factor BamE (lipoprotein component of BamABCDE complex)
MTASRSMDRTRICAAVALLALALGACAQDIETRIDTRGNWPREIQLEKIKSGEQTRSQVAELIGFPSSVSTFDDKTWYYISQVTVRQLFFKPKVVGQQVVAVRFDEKGRVAGVARLGLDEAREVEIVERTTPTASNEMSVLQQLLGNIGRFTDQGPRPGPGP